MPTYKKLPDGSLETTTTTKSTVAQKELDDGKVGIEAEVVKITSEYADKITALESERDEKLAQLNLVLTDINLKLSKF